MRTLLRSRMAQGARRALECLGIAVWLGCSCAAPAQEPVAATDAQIHRSDIRTSVEQEPTEFIVRLPRAESLPNGRWQLGPWLEVIRPAGVVDEWMSQPEDETLVGVEPPVVDGATLPLPPHGDGHFAAPRQDPMPVFSNGRRPVRPLASLLHARPHRGSLGWLLERSHRQKQFLGLGYERLGTGAFQMDNAEPYNHFGFRMESAARYRTPDIAEYFWAKTPNGRGPTNPLLPGQAESSVNYTDLIMTMEAGGKRMSAITQLPIRFLDPAINANTAGLGDMNVATKLVMFSGTDWRLSQVFRTYINTGAVSHGLGTGHVSMEPGLVFAWRPRPTTALHGELKYWFPLGADPEHSGQIVRYGLGINRVWFENDRFAILPSFEVVAFSVQDGRKTVREPLTGLPLVTELDGDTIVNFYPGVWFVSEANAKWDLGISSGFRVTGDQLYDQLFRLDLRFGY